jgi:hypothetical protein
MKIILSRKGFDGSAGGCASPILPDGRMASLPIPGGGEPIRYRDIQSHAGALGAFVDSLAKSTVRSGSIAHLDPDLDARCRQRPPGWRASLGQTGAAQSHLAAQGVGVGDLFLFFGWFRQAQADPSGRWSFVRGAPDLHVLFGYLQIGQTIALGQRPDRASVLEAHPWMHGHPHLRGSRHANNSVHVAADRLDFGAGPTGLPGAGVFEKFHPQLRLTALDAPSRSVWSVPDWLGPGPNRLAPTYHGDPSRWSRAQDGGALLRAVAKGQEFVFDTAERPEALAWARSLAFLAWPGLIQKPLEHCAKPPRPKP